MSQRLNYNQHQLSASVSNLSRHDSALFNKKPRPMSQEVILQADVHAKNYFNHHHNSANSSYQMTSNKSSQGRRFFDRSYHDIIEAADENTDCSSSDLTESSTPAKSWERLDVSPKLTGVTALQSSVGTSSNGKLNKSNQNSPFNKIRSRRASGTSDYSYAVESALECFDFLDENDDINPEESPESSPEHERYPHHSANGSHHHLNYPQSSPQRRSESHKSLTKSKSMNGNDDVDSDYEAVTSFMSNNNHDHYGKSVESSPGSLHQLLPFRNIQGGSVSALYLP